MTEVPGKLDKETIARIAREWDRLPREEGSGPAFVSATATEQGGVIVVSKNDEVQILTEEGRTSDLN